MRDIVESPAGTYWIATSRGLIRLNAGAKVEFERIGAPHNVVAVAAGGDSIWAATANGVYRVRPTPPRFTGAGDAQNVGER